MSKILLSTAGVLLPVLLSGQVKTWQPQLAESPAVLAAGQLRAAVGIGLAKKYLLAPVAAGQTWAVVDAMGSRVALPSIPVGALAILGHSQVAWTVPGPLGTKVHVQDLGNLRESAVSTDAPRIFDLAIVGDVVYVLFRDSFGWKLGRVKEGRFERLGSFDEPNSHFVFGLCNSERLVVVDPSEARFLVLRAPEFRHNGFVAMQSDVVESAKRRKSSAQGFGGTKLWVSNVFGHWETAKGHGFVVAHSEKGVGQYFVEFDDWGKEVRKSLLGYPEHNSKKSWTYYSKLMTGEGDMLESTRFSGETVSYRVPVD